MELGEEAHNHQEIKYDLPGPPKAKKKKKKMKPPLAPIDNVVAKNIEEKLKERSVNTA